MKYKHRQGPPPRKRYDDPKRERPTRDNGKVPSKLEAHRAHMLQDVLPSGETYRALMAECVREYDESLIAAKGRRRKIGVRFQKKVA